MMIWFFGFEVHNWVFLDFGEVNLASSLALFDTCWVSLDFFSDDPKRSIISSGIDTRSSYSTGYITASGIGRYLSILTSDLMNRIS